MTTIRLPISSLTQIVMTVLALLITYRSDAATNISPGAIAAWNQHVERSKDLLADEVEKYQRLSWMDREQDEMDRLRAGAILTAHPKKGAIIAVPSGLIHHSLGTAFIPNVRVTDLLATLQDYDSYSELYSPSVVDSKLLSRTPNAFQYQLKFAQKAFGVKAGLLGTFHSTYFRLAPDSGYCTTETTRLAELDNPGKPEERVLPLSASHGYIEGMFSILRYRQSDGGVYVEIDDLTLSRDIPASAKWLIDPMVQRFSRQLMITTLRRLREGVQERRTTESAICNRPGGC